MYLFYCRAFEYIHIISISQSLIWQTKDSPKKSRVLVLAAICEGMPVNATARMFRVGKHAVLRVIRETSEAFADYMDKNFRDLP